jgi:phosphate transport system protein
MDDRKHIVRSYDRELDLLKARLEEMGQAAEEQLASAIEALVTRDNRLARDVINRDPRINAFQNEIDGLAVEILALRQPMAHDLRHVISGLKIAAELERIADYAANVARHVMDLDHVCLEKPLDLIIRMAKIARGMLSAVMDAYQVLNVYRAIDVWKQDKEIDRIYEDLLSRLRLYMSVDSQNVQTYTNLIFVARCCERIGDHIKNIAESVYYIEYGDTDSGLDLPDGVKKENA